MTRAEKAKEYFLQGYACSQSVALPFVDLTTLSEDEIKRITLPFGGGFGRLRLVCGAVSGMSAIIGLTMAKDENTTQNKMDTYVAEREVCEKFQSEMGSLICSELLAGVNIPNKNGGAPQERNDEYYQKRPCAEIVYLAAEILEEYLTKHGKIK